LVTYHTGLVANVTQNFHNFLSLWALQALKIPNIVIFGPVANHANVATCHTQGLVATIQRATVYEMLDLDAEDEEDADVDVDDDTGELLMG
jgi:hypothetical protein